MRKFDTKIQYLKYKVLRAVARHAWADDLLEHVTDLPKEIMPGNKPTMRCCVYKERAILTERVKIAMGGDKSNPNVIEVINIACDECPSSGYYVTDACRGCVAHRCEDVCPRGALTFDIHQHAHIDKDKCINCGKCASVCPYSAINNRKRPCENACKIKAISPDGENGAAKISNEKCISCGACVYQCPFGAITDKSFILDAIRLIKESNNNENYKLFAVVAPSIASQFTFAKTGQIVTGIKRLGFYDVAEAAVGADMVAQSEAAELAEKGFLTSSCCPAFVSFVEKKYPKLRDRVSHNLSPAATVAKYIKENVENAKIIFIGPCTAKKMEFRLDRVKPYIDCVLTFEELQALFDSREIDVMTLEETPIDNASYFGRIFARSGGLSEAVGQALKEQGVDFVAKPIACDGIEQCNTALLKAQIGKLDANFIEGMACVGGCVNGAGCLTHDTKSKDAVNSHGAEVLGKTIARAIDEYKPE